MNWQPQWPNFTLPHMPHMQMPHVQMPHVQMPTLHVDKNGIKVTQAKSNTATRLDNASKTGVFALQDKNLMSFPTAALEIDKLRTLHIENCGLNKLPGEIVKTSQTLQRLKMPRNKLKDLPEGLVQLQKLEQMDFSFNLLKSVPECFVAMQKLKELVLSHNELTLLPGSISALEVLRVLDVSHNKLIGVPEGVGRLSNLEDLDASHNRIQKFPSSCESMTRLKRVNLESNGIDKLPADLLKNTPVIEVRVDNNPLKGGLEALEGYEAYAQRRGTMTQKVIAQKVGTGDLSAGLGAKK